MGLDVGASAADRAVCVTCTRPAPFLSLSLTSLGLTILGESAGVGVMVMRSERAPWWPVRGLIRHPLPQQFLQTLPLHPHPRPKTGAPRLA